VWILLTVLACAQKQPQPHDTVRPHDSGAPVVPSTPQGSGTWDTAPLITGACVFSACLSDPIGNWTVTAGCPGDVYTPTFAGTCFAIARNEWQQWTGELEFTADGAANLSITQWDYYETYLVPEACVATNCTDDFATPFGWTCTDTPGGGCTCTEHTTQNSDVTQHLEWWATANKISIGRQGTPGGGATTIGTYRICRTNFGLKLQDEEYGYIVNADPL
jgi:hypothetical protein